MDLGIANKNALVCASSKGLGRGCAEALAEAGVNLVMNARGKDALEEAANGIRARFDVRVQTVAAILRRLKDKIAFWMWQECLTY